MVFFGDSSGVPVGYIHQNILALNDGTVVGVLLGHCIFDWNGKVSAKYFRRSIFLLQGQILAKEISVPTEGVIPGGEFLSDGWKIISKIKDHSCPTIDPSDQWSSISLDEHFYSFPALQKVNQSYRLK